MELFRRSLHFYVIAILVGAATLGTTTNASAFDTPQIDSPVVDHAGVLGNARERAIGERLRAHYDKTGVQMAVLLVDTTGHTTIDAFSIRTAERWGGGRAGEDRGVLLTLAVDDRRSRLEVGYGLESVIPDLMAARILEQVREPLREKRYGDAVKMAVDRVLAETDHLEAGDHGWTRGASPFWRLMLGFFLIVSLGMAVSAALTTLNRRDVGLFGTAWSIPLVLLLISLGGLATWLMTADVAPVGYIGAYAAGLFGGMFTGVSRGWGRVASFFVLFGLGLLVLLDAGPGMPNMAPEQILLIVSAFYSLACLLAILIAIGIEFGGSGHRGSTFHSGGITSGGFSGGSVGGFSGGGYSGGGGSFGGGGASGGW